MHRLTARLAALAGMLLALPTQAETPRLILQLTVDGLRADMLEEYAENFGDHGFNRLLNSGLVYTNAHYQHANTETIVGHTTLATGATPAVHGMVGNVWFHRESGELGYNIEDPEAPLLPTRKENTEGAQVDPAQLRANTDGRSPVGILAPTFADTLAETTGGSAKIFGISAKDRSAVAMAGKAGTAYWYSTDSGDFQSSAYYMDSYPDWVVAWNEKGLAAKLSNNQWQLAMPPERYRPGRVDDRPYETDLKGFGRTFPHDYGPAQHPLFFTRVLVSPAGDRLLLDFARKLVVEENLGADKTTDYLAISFSGVDAVNHFFGPSSIENEDVVIALDRTLQELFTFIDAQIGMDKVLIVLSADHGMADIPEYAAEQGRDAGRLYSSQILELARAASEKLYGEPALVKDFFRPYIYLDSDALGANKLQADKVAAALATELEKVKGVDGAVTAREALSGKLQGTEAQVARNHHPQRSGDIYLYQSPHWFMFDDGPISAMHGSPWEYDTHVPILFAGPGIKAGRVSRPVHPVDVAPTLSALLGLPAPAAAQGRALKEVTGAKP